MSKRTLILFCLLLSLAVSVQAAAPESRLVRIGLTQVGHPSRVNVQPSSGFIEVFDAQSNSGIFSGPCPAGITLSAGGAGVVVALGGKTIYSGTHPVLLSSVGRPPSHMVLMAGARRGQAFRGSLEVRGGRGGGLRFINVVPLEDYLMSVVPSEIDVDAPPAALQAQAIAARSYILRNRNRHGADYDLCDQPHCQAYTGMRKETPECSRAVRATAGQILIYNGEPINAMYHCNCGGVVRSVREVFGGGGQPYLARHPDRVGNGHAFCSWSRNFGRGAQVVRRAARGAQPNGRPERATVNTALRKGRRAEARDVVVEVRGRGRGHGVGMCQDGATGMARAGYNARQILGFYYPGTQLLVSGGATATRLAMSAPAPAAATGVNAPATDAAGANRANAKNTKDDKPATAPVVPAKPGVTTAATTTKTPAVPAPAAKADEPINPAVKARADREAAARLFASGRSSAAELDVLPPTLSRAIRGSAPQPPSHRRVKLLADLLGEQPAPAASAERDAGRTTTQVRHLFWGNAGLRTSPRAADIR